MGFNYRDPRFRYIVWKGGGHALYDHAKDPCEHYNLADNPEYTSVAKRNDFQRNSPEQLGDQPALILQGGSWVV